MAHAKIDFYVLSTAHVGMYAWTKKIINISGSKIVKMGSLIFFVVF